MAARGERGGGKALGRSTERRRREGGRRRRGGRQAAAAAPAQVRKGRPPQAGRCRRPLRGAARGGRARAPPPTAAAGPPLGTASRRWRGGAAPHATGGPGLASGAVAGLSFPVPSRPVPSCGRAGGRAAGSSARCQRKAAVLLRNGKYRQGCCIGSRSAASYGRGSVNHAVYKDESRLKNPGFDKSALISLQSYYRVISKRRSRDPVCSCHECNCQVKQGRLPGRKTLSRVFRCW